LLSSGKFLPPQSQIRLRLKRSDPRLFVDCPTLTSESAFNCEFRIEEIYMLVKRVLVHEQVLLKHEDILNAGQRFLFPYKDSQAVSYTVATGVTSHLSENLCVGNLPSSLIFAITDSSKFFGKYNATSFTFAPESLRDVRILIDGEPLFSQPLDIDAASKGVLLPYSWSFGALDADASSHGITLDQFLDNKFVLFISLVPSSKLNSYQPLRQGTLRIELRFKTATEKNLTAICVMQTNKVLGIDKFSQIYID